MLFEVVITALMTGIIALLLNLTAKVTRLETKIGLCKSCPVTDGKGENGFPFSSDIVRVD